MTGSLWCRHPPALQAWRSTDRYRTYDELILSAENQYEEYLASSKVSKAFDELLGSLDSTDDADGTGDDPVVHPGSEGSGTNTDTQDDA